MAEVEDDDIGTGIYVSKLEVSDVLLGRGTGPYTHEGNVKFRNVVAALKPVYMATRRRTEKLNLLRAAVNDIKTNGRFLTKVSKWKIKKLKLDKSAVYEVVKDSIACEKTKQAVRYLHYRTEPTKPLEQQETSAGASKPCPEIQTSRARRRTKASLADGSSISTVQSPPVVHSIPALSPSKRKLQATTKDGSTKHATPSLVCQESQNGSTLVFPPHLNGLQTLNESGHSTAGSFQTANVPNSPYGLPQEFSSSLCVHPDEILLPRPLRMNLPLDVQGLHDHSMLPVAMPIPLCPTLHSSPHQWMAANACPTMLAANACPTMLFLTAHPYSANRRTAGVPTGGSLDTQHLPSTTAWSSCVMPLPCTFPHSEGPWIPPPAQHQGSQPSPSPPPLPNSFMAGQFPAVWVPPSAPSNPGGPGFEEPASRSHYPFVRGLSGDIGRGGSSSDTSLGVQYSLSDNDDNEEDEDDEDEPSFDCPDSLLESQRILYRMQMQQTAASSTSIATAAATATAATAAAAASARTSKIPTASSDRVHCMSRRRSFPPSTAAFELWERR